MRKKIARFFFLIGNFIQSLAVVVMKPKDLIEFGRDFYMKPESIETWSQKKSLAIGLTQEEKELLFQLPLKKGRLLLLGIGGGRDAIPLAKMGYKVTGVDYVPELVERAKISALKEGVKIEGIVQEISHFDVENNSFDIVWLCSYGMYSHLPSRAWRIDMLERIRRALKSGGYFVCQFMQGDADNMFSKGDGLRKIFAYLTFGNTKYEKGDGFYNYSQFVHIFSADGAVKTEFEDAGFEVIYFNIFEGGRGGAILRKP
jgi:SAM-dependent methyltransferase